MKLYSVEFPNILRLRNYTDSGVLNVEERLGFWPRKWLKRDWANCMDIIVRCKQRDDDEIREHSRIRYEHEDIFTVHLTIIIYLDAQAVPRYRNVSITSSTKHVISK